MNDADKFNSVLERLRVSHRVKRGDYVADWLVIAIMALVDRIESLEQLIYSRSDK